VVRGRSTPDRHLNTDTWIRITLSSVYIFLGDLLSLSFFTFLSRVRLDTNAGECSSWNDLALINVLSSLREHRSQSSAAPPCKTAHAIVKIRRKWFPQI
jgi:hypothetical protein